MVGAVSRTTLITGGAGYVGALACRGTARRRAPGSRSRPSPARAGGRSVDLEAAGVGADPWRRPRRGRARSRAAGRRRGRASRRDRRRPGLRPRSGDCCRGQHRGDARHHRRGAAGRRRHDSCSASTCSNYGRMVDPTIPIDETGELRPVSLYAEQKVAIERLLLGQELGSLRPTCLRFATVYGVAPRMRFDLTVNNVARDLFGRMARSRSSAESSSGGPTCTSTTRPAPSAPSSSHQRDHRARRLQRRRLARELPQARSRRGDPQADPTRRGDLRAPRGGSPRLQGQLRQDQRHARLQDACMGVPGASGRSPARSGPTRSARQRRSTLPATERRPAADHPPSGRRKHCARVTHQPLRHLTWYLTGHWHRRSAGGRPGTRSGRGGAPRARRAPPPLRVPASTRSSAPSGPTSMVAEPRRTT